MRPLAGLFGMALLAGTAVDCAGGGSGEATGTGAPSPQHAPRRLLNVAPADPVFVHLRDAERHPALVPTTGRLQDPLPTLHETGDLTGPVSMEQQYLRRVHALGNGHYLVQRLVRGAGHCLFSEQELVQARDNLVRRFSTGARPAGENILGDLSDAGLLFANPVRDGDPAQQ